MFFSPAVLRKILPPAGLASVAAYAATAVPVSSSSLRPMHGGTPLLIDESHEDTLWNPVEVWFPI